jgi:PAS domain S-box-containing protein
MQEKYIEKTLAFIAQKGNELEGNEFLKIIAKYIGDLFNVSYVLIDKYSFKKPSITETVAIYSKDGFSPNIKYELANTPCENVINKKLCIYPKNIQTLFPKDELLTQMNVESYMGIPLWSSNREPIGLIAVLDDKPIQDTKTLEVILQIIAIKTAQVLEKKLYENELKLQEQYIKESKSKLQKAQQVSNMGFLEWNLQTNQILLSNGIIKLYELDPKNKYISIEQLVKLVPIEDRDIVQYNLDLALKGKKKYHIDHRIVTPKGKLLWVEAQADLTFDNLGNPISLLGTVVNITSRKNTVLQLNTAFEIIKEKETYLRTILKTTEEGFWVIDTIGNTLEANPKMCKILGYTEKELIGKNIFEFVDKNNATIFKEQLKQRDLGKSSSYEIELLKNNKQSITCLFKTSPLYNKENVRIGSFAMVTDISKLKNTFNKLQINYNKQKLLSDELFEKNSMLFESQNKYKNLFEQSPVSLWEIDFSEVKKLLNKKKAATTDLKKYLDKNPEFVNLCISNINILNVNAKTLKLLGLRKKEELKKHLVSSNSEKALKALKNEFLAIASNEIEFTTETEYLNTDGSIITAILKSVLIEKGGGINLVSVIDITNSRKVEQEIRDSEYFLNESQKIAKIGSYSLEFKTGLWKSSKVLNSLFGIDAKYKKDISGWMAVIHPKDRMMMQEYFETNIVKNHEFFNKEYRIIRVSDKTKRWMHGFGELQFDKSGNLIKMIGTIQDVTARKEAENQILLAKGKAEESEKKFKELYEKSGDSISMIHNGKFVDCNKATLDLLKFKTKDDFLNTSYLKLSPELQPDGRNSFEKSKEMAKIAHKNGFHKFEWVHTKKTGENVPVEILLTSILNEPNNRIIHSVWRDITSRKKAELELIRAKEKAEESNRLKTEFLNNMSHEIRTPMNGILGFSEFLGNANLPEKKRKHFVNIIQNSGNQLLRVMDDILEISRLETKQVKVQAKEVCLNDLLLELFSVFDIKAKENDTPLYLKKSLSDEESTILTDKVKLNKVLSNLLENALKFTNQGYIEFGYNLKKNEKVNELEIFVKDNGIGIHPDKHKTIFERFSQANIEFSKNLGGLGLGLSIAKENTELLGGKINVVSKKEKGATFTITLPYKPVYENNNSNKKTEETLKKQSGVILIAEDEEVNYLFLEILLKESLQLNCQLLHAKDGVEAVEICKNNPDIKFVLMDIKMPEMDGYEATQKIKEMYPNLPIIAQTAYSTKEEKGKAILAGCDDFISKPICEKKLGSVLKKYIKKSCYN